MQANKPSLTVLAATMATMLATTVAGCVTTPRGGPLPVVEARSYDSVPFPTSLDGGDSVQRFFTTDAVDARWWTAFGSPALDALVDAALAGNAGLAAAQATLKAANETALAQRGSLLPSVDLQYSPTRTKVAGNQAGATSLGVQGDGSVIAGFQGTPASQGGTAPFNGPVTYTYHTAQVNVGYQPDLFGVARGQLRAAQADANVQRLELEAARLALAGNVVAAALDDALLRQQIAVTERQATAARSQLELARHQQQAGLVPRSALAAQELSTAQLEAQLPPLRRQLEQNRDLLRVLGGQAQDRDLPVFALEEFRLPEQLPEVLPSTLVARRPDVRAAAAALEAAGIRAGVARRARLPQLSLSGTLGGTAAHFDQMFWSSGSFFDLTANLVQPLFRGGTLLHQERAAKAAAEAAAAQYRGSVLTAFQNVADSLHALKADAEGVKAASAAERGAALARDGAQRQLGAGDIDRIGALNTVLVHGQAELALGQARAARLADTAALFVALGGGSGRPD